MLKPKQMSRLLIAASRDQMGPVVAELYRHHLFHIEEYVEGGAEGYEGFKIGTPLSGASEASVDLLKIRAIENAVSIHGDDMDSAQACSRSELKSRIERELPVLEREVEELTGRRSKLDTKVKEFEQKIAEITPFVSIPAGSRPVPGIHGVSPCIAGYVAREADGSGPERDVLLQRQGEEFHRHCCPVRAAERGRAGPAGSSIPVSPDPR